MPPAEPFQPHGPSHLWTLAVIAAVAVVMPLLVRRFDHSRPVAIALGIVLVAQQAVETWLRVEAGWTSAMSLLPFHLCTVTIYLTAFVLFTRNQRAYEVAYFWATGGTLQALVTPDVYFDFPHPAFLSFFAGHGTVIVAIAYATFVFGLRPRLRSIPRAMGVTAAYAAVMFLVNLALDTNFLYLMAKPGQPSILDWLGPWPWYLLGLAGVALASMVVWTLPFVVANRLRRRHHR
jgi:hypothetical integral membrane protein (TIGR02206 family)